MSRSTACLVTPPLLALLGCTLVIGESRADVAEAVTTTMPVPTALQTPMRCPAPSPIAGMQRADGLPEQGITRDLPAIRNTENRLPVEVSSDSAQIGVDGAALLSGRVELRQGERRLEAEEVRYDRASGQFSVRASDLACSRDSSGASPANVVRSSVTRGH